MKYFDIRTNLDVHPINGDLLRLTDEQAIAGQIKNLILIAFYEIPWKPTIGAGVRQTLFENFDEDAEYMIKTRIKDVIQQHVSRAKLIDVILKYDGNNGYTVTIVFKPLNSTEPVNLIMTLKRTR